MAKGFHFFHSQKRTHQVQLAFVILSGALSLVLTAASPFLAYLLFTSIVASLSYSFSSWENLAKVEKPRAKKRAAALTANPTQRQEETIMGDVITKVVGATVITVIGLYFSLHFVAISQLIIGTFVGSALAWFFMDQCVIHSQKALNQALRKAVEQSQRQAVHTLMQRGADPYAEDKNGDMAFHHAIQNNADTAEIIALLKSKDHQKRITFKKVLGTFKGFCNQEIKQKTSDLILPFKNTFRENTQANRLAFYQALGHLVNAFFAAAVNLVDCLVAYLRQEIASPKNINKPNQARLRPVDLVEIRKITGKYREGILHTFNNTNKPTHRKIIKSPETPALGSLSRPYRARR